MARGELYLWWTGESENIFVYYLTGAMALSFLITIAIIRSLRRKESRVVEILHEETGKDMLVTFLLSVTTSIKQGSNCPDNVKVFMQLRCEHKASQFFSLKAHPGGRPMFQRGLVDIFMFKVPVSLGKINGVKLVLSGVEKSFSWQISRIQLFEPATAELRDLPATVLATEIIGFGDATEKVIQLEKPYAEWFVYMCTYHQWIAGFIKSVWFGAFSETVHIISIFVTLFNIFTLALIAFIILPGGTIEDSFDINLSSMLIGSFSVSFLGSLLCLVFELLIRNVRSQEKDPGTAYRTVIKENNGASKMACIRVEDVQEGNKDNIWTAFVMQSEEFENQSGTSEMSLKSACEEKISMPSYLGRLLPFLEAEEDKLQEREKQRLALLGKGMSMLCLRKSVQASQVSFLTCAQSYTDVVEINLPRFSELCFERLLSSKTSLSVMMDMEDDIILPKTHAESYLDFLKRRLDKDKEYKGELVYIRGREKFGLIQKDSEEWSIGSKQSEGITWKRDGKQKSSSSLTEASGKDPVREHRVTEFNTGTQKYLKTFDKDCIMTLKDNLNMKSELSQDSGEKWDEDLKDHVVDIDDIDIKETEMKASVPEIKIDITEDEMTLRRRPLATSKASLYLTKALKDDSSLSLMRSRETTDSESASASGEDEIALRKQSLTESKGLLDTTEMLNSEDCMTVKKPISKVAAAGKTSITNHLPKVGFSAWRRRSRNAMTQQMWLEWQKAQKEWSRKLVQAVHRSFTAFRTDLMSGVFVTASIDIVLLEWSQEVIKRISAGCIMRRKTFEKELLESENLLQLFTHLSLDIIMLAVRDVYRSVRATEFVAIADLVTQSHHIMMAVEHAADCITFFLNRGLQQLQEQFKYLDMGQDLLDVRDTFLEMCFDLVVTHNDITWGFCLELLKDERRQRDLLQLSQDRLMEFVKAQMGSENEEDVAVKKLCHMVENEARQEVWREVNSPEKMFVSSLIKQEIVKELSAMIKKNKMKKESFDIKYNLIPALPKSRLEKLVEKRRKKVQIVDERGGKEAEAEQNVNKAEVEVVSRALGRYIQVLVYIRDTVRRKWTRQGLKMASPVGKYLAQALLHPQVQTDRTKPAKYHFKNFLHLKRAESLLETFFKSMVLEMAKVLMSDVVQEHSLRTADLTDKEKAFVLDDLLVKANIMSVVLMQDVRCYTQQVVGMETSSTSIGMAMVHRSSHLLLRKSSSMMNRNYSTIPSQIVDQVSYRVEESAKKDYNEIGSPSDNCDVQCSISPSAPAETATSKASDAIDEDFKPVSVQDLIDELKPLKAYLTFIQDTEMLRSQITQEGYMAREKEQWEYAHSVSINNMIDSYYMIQAGDDSHTFTKAGLFQLEHDLVGENSRLLPGCTKSLMVCLMVLLIIANIVYIMLVGGQLTTTQIQEWVCYSLLSLTLFGFLFEPIRAMILGYLFCKS